MDASPTETSAPATTKHRSGTSAPPRPRSPFVPLLVGGITLVGWFALQTWLLIDERSRLDATHSAQQQTVDNATRLRRSLDAIAADTQRLADSGNPNARLLVEELRKRGVTINANSTTAADDSKPPARSP